MSGVSKHQSLKATLLVPCIDKPATMAAPMQASTLWQPASFSTAPRTSSVPLPRRVWPESR
eukprot:1130698-Rhodomonas_salina.3